MDIYCWNMFFDYILLMVLQETKNILSQTNDSDLHNELKNKLLDLSFELYTLNEKYTKQNQQYVSDKKLLKAERLTTVSVSIKINTILCYYFIAKDIISFLII